MTLTDVRRGDVVLVASPFVGESGVAGKRRPAVVIQSDRYNSRRSATILAMIDRAIADALGLAGPG